MIEIRNLNKYYGNRHILKNIMLTIPEGQIFGLVGKSGAGKSTLLRCINGLETYQAGEVSINNKVVHSLNDQETRFLRKEMGMIFQQFSLIKRATVYENIAIPLKCWGFPRNKIREKIMTLLDAVDLSNKVDVKIRELSGGQQQRVAIARALALDPSILLCDEATSALDPASTEDIVDLLLSINKNLKKTIIVVTHEMDVVKKLCDNMAILKDGEIIQSGSVEEIFKIQPPSLMNLLGIEKSDSNQVGVTDFCIITSNKQHPYLLTQAANDLRIEFEVIGITKQELKDTVVTTSIIRIKDAYKDKFEKYLEQRKVDWRIEN